MAAKLGDFHGVFSKETYIKWSTMVNPGINPNIDWLIILGCTTLRAFRTHDFLAKLAECLDHFLGRLAPRRLDEDTQKNLQAMQVPGVFAHWKRVISTLFYN